MENIYRLFRSQSAVDVKLAATLTRGQGYSRWETYLHMLLARIHVYREIPIGDRQPIMLLPIFSNCFHGYMIQIYYYITKWGDRILKCEILFGGRGNIITSLISIHDDTFIFKHKLPLIEAKPFFDEVYEIFKEEGLV